MYRKIGRPDNQTASAGTKCLIYKGGKIMNAGAVEKDNGQVQMAVRKGEDLWG